jgi:hypothetical protein
MWDVIELRRSRGDTLVWWRYIGAGLVLPLAHWWLLSLLLLVKDVGGILQLCEPCLLSVSVLPMSFGMLSDCLPSHDEFLLLPEPLYLLLHPDQLFLLYCGFVLFSFIVPILHLV